MKKIALVTGASSGMGRECVRFLGKNPGDVEEIWAVARRRERLHELSGEKSGNKGKIPVRALAFDLLKEEDLDKLSGILREEKPEIRVLINAAGVGKIGNIGEYPEEESAMIRLNCEALTRVTAIALPFLGRGASVLQFASAAAFLPQPGFAVYAATKSYVLSYSRALAAELSRRKIRVTAVCPGPVETEFFGRAGDISRIPPYKRLSPEKPEIVVRTAFLDNRAGKQV